MWYFWFKVSIYLLKLVEIELTIPYTYKCNPVLFPGVIPIGPLKYNFKINSNMTVTLNIMIQDIRYVDLVCWSLASWYWQYTAGCLRKYGIPTCDKKQVEKAEKSRGKYYWKSAAMLRIFVNYTWIGCEIKCKSFMNKTWLRLQPPSSSA